jgi:predicted nucleotide-binding protein
MATKKTQIQPLPATILVKPRDVFKTELNERIEIGEDLHNTTVQTMDELTELQKKFSDWNDYNRELIKRAFNNGNQSEYYLEYYRVNDYVGLYDSINRVNKSHPAYKHEKAKERIQNCVTILKRLVEKLPLIAEEHSIQGYNTKDRSYYNRGFIVHGHNEARKFEIARFIENDLKRKAIILHEQANKGRTIIEKFEDYSSVDFAVALWTGDDFGRVKTSQEDNLRARQNVIFETGFFIGKIGRKNVIVLYEDGVEIPSDYTGVIFIRLADNWKDDLRKEIEAIYE